MSEKTRHTFTIGDQRGTTRYVIEGTPLKTANIDGNGASYGVKFAAPPASPLPAEVEEVVGRLDGLDRHDEAFGLGELLDQAAAVIRSLSAQLETVKGYSMEMLHRKDEQFERAEAIQSELDKARAEVARMREALERLVKTNPQPLPRDYENARAALEGRP